MSNSSPAGFVHVVPALKFVYWLCGGAGHSQAPDLGPDRGACQSGSVDLVEVHTRLLRRALGHKP